MARSQPFFLGTFFYSPKDCNADSSDEEIAEYVKKVIALAEKQSGEKAEMEEPSKQENNDAKKKTNKNWLKRKRKIKPRE